MTSPHKKLQEWHDHGLIDATTLRAITEYEASQGGHPRWLYAVMLLGVSVVALGVISMIAANWERIPDVAKLGADFLLLGGLAAGVLHLGRGNTERGVGFEILLTGFCLLCLASIGLISQIYHTGGKWEHALLLWLSITFPLLLFSRHPLGPGIWVALLLPTAASLLLGHGEHHFEHFIYLLVLIPASLLALSRPLPALQSFSAAFRFWLLAIGLVSLVAADFMRSDGNNVNLAARYLSALPYVMLALTAAILLQRNSTPLQRGLLLTILLCWWTYTNDAVFTGTLLQSDNAPLRHHALPAHAFSGDNLRAPLLSLVILAAFAAHCAVTRHFRLMSLATLLIGLRFVVLYFQALGGLAATGIGLMLSGLLIMGMGWGWFRLNRILRTRFEGIPA